MELRKKLIRYICSDSVFALYQALAWCVCAAYGAFFTLWLRSRGVAFSEAAVFTLAFLVMAIMSLVKPQPKTLRYSFSICVSALSVGFAAYGILLLHVRSKLFLLLFAPGTVLLAAGMILVFLTRKRFGNSQKNGSAQVDGESEDNVNG
ncbi:MAG: hypothetical protein IJY04_06235 [Clostridia bacterium]|nr:hypothetical protein [Clostridia bacterium]